MADIRTSLVAPAPAPAPPPTASAAPLPRPFDEARSARIQAALEERLSPEEISTRDGQGGQKVCYVEAWRMIDKAQRIFGFDGWSSTVLNMAKEFEEKNASTSRFSVGYTCMVRVTLMDGTFHDDVGFGSTVNEKDRGKGIENARKEAVSDGMKRALRHFGHGLGLGVYDKAHCKEAADSKKRPAAVPSAVAGPAEPKRQATGAPGPSSDVPPQFRQELQQQACQTPQQRQPLQAQAQPPPPQQPQRPPQQQQPQQPQQQPMGQPPQMGGPPMGGGPPRGAPPGGGPPGQPPPRMGAPMGQPPQMGQPPPQMQAAPPQMQQPQMQQQPPQRSTPPPQQQPPAQPGQPPWRPPPPQQHPAQPHQPPRPAPQQMHQQRPVVPPSGYAPPGMQPQGQGVQPQGVRPPGMQQPVQPQGMRPSGMPAGAPQPRPQ